jgi:exodeoxyribonuclease VII small subunit
MQEPTFEGSLKRLEEIVAQLEDNKLALEQSLQVFEEGVKLVRFCAGRLDEAERRIEILLADKEGQFPRNPRISRAQPSDRESGKERPWWISCATYRSRKRSLMRR